MNIIRKRLLETGRLLAEGLKAGNPVQKFIEKADEGAITCGKGSVVSGCSLNPGCRLVVGDGCTVTGVVIDSRGPCTVTIGDNSTVVNSSFCINSEGDRKASVGAGSLMSGAIIVAAGADIGPGAVLVDCRLVGGQVKLGSGAALYLASLGSSSGSSGDTGVDVFIGQRLTMAPYDLLTASPGEHASSELRRLATGGLPSPVSIWLDLARMARLVAGDDALVCQRLKLIVEGGPVRFGSGFRVVPYDQGDSTYWYDHRNAAELRYCRLGGGDCVTMCVGARNNRPSRWRRLSEYRPNSLYLSDRSTLTVACSDRTPQQTVVGPGRLLVI